MRRSKVARRVGALLATAASVVHENKDLAEWFSPHRDRAESDHDAPPENRIRAPIPDQLLTQA
jgi:hypothetical protein